MRGIIRLGIVVSLLVAGCSSGAIGPEPEAAKDVFTPILGSILGGPTSAVLGTDGRHYVVYELVLTNAKAVPATLQAVKVLDPESGATLIRFEGAQLLRMLRELNARPAADLNLPPNESRVVLITLDFPAAWSVPTHLEHRLDALATGSPSAQTASPVSYRVAPFALASRDALVLQPPLEGQGWVVINGCCGDTGAHRGAIQSINGRLVNSQRFAIDFVQADAQGRLVVGDPTDVRSWVSYGAPVLAAAAGLVVAARNDLPNQVPGSLPDPATITVDNVDGNFVVLDHGRDLFTFYAHLVPGGVRVAPGDRVKANQPLGLLGNTGNTSAPHLHFHLMAGPSPLASDGLPFVFARFSLAGVIDDAALNAALDGAASLPTRSSVFPVNRAKQLPLDLSFIDFGPDHRR